MDITSPPDIVIVAGGSAFSPSLVPFVGADTVVIAVDRGVERAIDLGWSIDVAVGDFDSLDPAFVARLDDLALEVQRHDADKDLTDLELALDVSLRRGSGRVLVVGIEGGRPDHALANLLLVASDRFRSLDVEMALDHGRAWVVHHELHGSLPAGALLSVLPVHGPAVVSIDGVRWPLDHRPLAAGTTQGVSNEAVGGQFDLTIHTGTAISIIPHPEESP